MRTVLVVFVIALLGTFARPAGAASHVRYDLMLPGIDLRSGITADLHATVFVDETHPCNGNVALTIHGLLHTAATWEPFVASLFEDNPAGRKLCRVVALDMPGRGGTSAPAAGSFSGRTTGGAPPLPPPPGLFLSVRRPDGAWSPLVSLGDGINSPVAGVNCEMLSPDGRYLFFTRGGDIYWAPPGCARSSRRSCASSARATS